MTLSIPASLKAEHDELHRHLAAALTAPGAVGEAAKRVAALLHSHFIDEEAFALPPLGLLAVLTGGKQITDVAEVTAMTDRLTAELPRMLTEHQAITAALRELQTAARAAGDDARARLAFELSMPVTIAPRLCSSIAKSPSPHPTSKSVRPRTSPSRSRISRRCGASMITPTVDVGQRP